jgi:hypothetical protein
LVDSGGKGSLGRGIRTCKVVREDELLKDLKFVWLEGGRERE